MTHRRPDRSRHLGGERPADLPRRRRPVGGPRPDDGRHPRGVRRRPRPGAPVLRRAARRPRPGPAQRRAPRAGPARGGARRPAHLVTQNIDDLHERGGSRRVHHMHGRLRAAWCTRLRRAARRGTARCGDRPACPACGEPTLRPDVVWFGEVPYGMDAIEEALWDVRPLRLDRHVGAGLPGGGLRALRRRQRQGDPRAQPGRERGERRRRPSPAAARPPSWSRPGSTRCSAGPEAATASSPGDDDRLRRLGDRQEAPGTSTRRPSSESTSIRPPWRSTTRWVIVSPSPVPGRSRASRLVLRKNSVNSRPRSSSEMPRPSSAHSSTTWSPWRHSESRTQPPGVGVADRVGEQVGDHAGQRRLVPEHHQRLRRGRRTTSLTSRCAAASVACSTTEVTTGAGPPARRRARGRGRPPCSASSGRRPGWRAGRRRG